MDLQQSIMDLFEKQDKEKCEKVYDTVNKYIDEADKSGNKVVYIRQVVPNQPFYRLVFGKQMTKGNPGAELAPKLKIVSDNIFNKMFPSALTNKDFVAWLNENNVTDVDVIGGDSAGCAYATSKALRKAGINVNLLCNGLLTFFIDKTIKCKAELEKLGANYIGNTSDIFVFKRK